MSTVQRVSGTALFGRRLPLRGWIGSFILLAGALALAARAYDSLATGGPLMSGASLGGLMAVVAFATGGLMPGFVLKMLLDTAWS